MVSFNTGRLTKTKCQVSLVIKYVFRMTKNALIDPKGSQNIFCTMMKYGETFQKFVTGTEEK